MVRPGPGLKTLIVATPSGAGRPTANVQPRARTGLANDVADPVPAFGGPHDASSSTTTGAGRVVRTSTANAAPEPPSDARSTAATERPPTGTLLGLADGCSSDRGETSTSVAAASKLATSTECNAPSSGTTPGKLQDDSGRGAPSDRVSPRRVSFSAVNVSDRSATMRPVRTCACNATCAWRSTKLPMGTVIRLRRGTAIDWRSAGAMKPASVANVRSTIASSGKGLKSAAFSSAPRSVVPPAKYQSVPA